MKDRISLASVCVLVSTFFFYAPLAWKLFEAGSLARTAGVVLGVLCLGAYLLAVFLAIELTLWAWQGCYAILAMQLAAAVLLLGRALASESLDILVVVAIALVVAASVLGLWAVSRPASRSLCAAHA